MSRLSDKKIISILRNELTNSINYSIDGSSGASGDIEKALKYYQGEPNGRERPGKSAVTSTDVADAIEWLMPQIINALTQNNQVVDFDATSPQDELQAKVEASFCYDTFMKYNDGFVQAYYFIKDALLHKNGIFKCYYESEDKTTVEKYTGLVLPQLQMLLANPNITLLSKTESLDDMGQQRFDVKIKIKRCKGNICIEAVPLEEFRVNSSHSSILLDKARFTAHVTKKTVSDLVEEGFDPEKMAKLPEYDEYLTSMRHRSTAELDSTLDKSLDESLKELAVSECYCMMDVDQDGVAEYVKIIVAGSETGPMTILSIDELNYRPWVSGSPILMAHKFLGMSIYDRLKEIQDQKTALLRNIFDNFYLQNNQRYKVLENQVDLKDLLVSRAGGIVKVKSMDAIQPLETMPFGGEALNLMNYLDTIRAGRVGVSAEGSTAPQNIGDRVGSLGLDKLMTAKEELVNLIIRTLAETGFKPLMFKIRELARSNFKTEMHYKFQNQWITVNPSQWKDRTAATIRVGTGTGNKTEKLTALQGILSIQQQIIASGQPQVMVDEPQLFATINEICELSGLLSAEKYFNNPTAPQAQQKKQQMQQASQQEKQIRDGYEAKLADSQIALGQAEVQKANAQMQNVQYKAQIEQLKLKLESERLRLEDQISQLQQQLDAAETAANTALKKRELDLREQQQEDATAIELTRIEVEAKAQQDANFSANMKLIDDSEDKTEGVDNE